MLIVERRRRLRLLSSLLSPRAHKRRFTHNNDTGRFSLSFGDTHTHTQIRFRDNKRRCRYLNSNNGRRSIPGKNSNFFIISPSPIVYDRFEFDFGVAPRRRSQSNPKTSVVIIQRTTMFVSTFFRVCTHIYGTCCAIKGNDNNVEVQYNRMFESIQASARTRNGNGSIGYRLGIR